MSLSAPTQVVFIIAIVIAILALVVFFGVFSIGISSFWIMTVAFVVLAVGCLVKGM
ncbi:MAG TPA: hypothetical protein VM487_14030 [Phycisphaerae bacterium]|nr:hypothetical protein [Phycisphaerae bacterium]